MAGMSALKRLSPFTHVGGHPFGGHPFRGRCAHIEPQYRQFLQLTRSQVIQAEFFNAVLGHYPYPDPSQWTDEELVIPPDDED
ncbi:hypothetical protein FD755_013788 [Muntiacus reevesi]|uniref:NADH dehydrogenase [ubiquinone] 1 beta subcomplex subunit 2, mitochondrial n=1 Tax=Muntiacus reevesi TaxID=9886 RepID=A0A5N3XN07_MUNRE|nr:hypothetical protein FD755_013788 [Muntiacus reevesi]